MSAFEIQYVDAHGLHAECVEAWDLDAAIHEFRLNHRGEDIRMLDAIYVRSAEEEVPA